MTVLSTINGGTKVYTREVEIVRVRRQDPRGGYQASISAKDGDTELKFVVTGTGDAPAWIREGKQLNLTIEVDRPEEG